VQEPELGAGDVKARSRVHADARAARSAAALYVAEHSSRIERVMAGKQRVCAALPGPFLGEKFPDLWDEFHRDLHGRVGGGFVRCFVLRHGLFVGLRLVLFENPANAFFVPTFRKCWLLHFFLRRRSALSAFGPRSYPVITNAESGAGSGT